MEDPEEVSCHSVERQYWAWFLRECLAGCKNGGTFVDGHLEEDRFLDHWGRAKRSEDSVGDPDLVATRPEPWRAFAAYSSIQREKSSPFESGEGEMIPVAYTREFPINDPFLQKISEQGRRGRQSSTHQVEGYESL
jgi:hypothetical protein